MISAARQPDRNVDGILHYLRTYQEVREKQAVRINPRLAGIIGDLAWMNLEHLRQVLHKPKAFGGEKFRVADVLCSGDDLKRKALTSVTDQNSILPEIINRADEQTKRVAELTIHDSRTLFRAIDPSLENVVQLIQHWLFWDLPDAADLHHFDEQVRRLSHLAEMEIGDELKARYRQALGKRADETIETHEILRFEIGRLEHIVARFVHRRDEEEPYQMIIGRDDNDGEPFDYKGSQAEELRERVDAQKAAMEEKLHPSAAELSDSVPPPPPPVQESDTSHSPA